MSVDIPAFLDRSKWTAEQHRKNDEAWAARLARRAAEDSVKRQAESAARERIRIEQRLTNELANPEPGSVNEKVAAGLRAKLAKMEQENGQAQAGAHANAGEGAQARQTPH